jgi:hypothetical protein
LQVPGVFLLQNEAAVLKFCFKTASLKIRHKANICIIAYGNFFVTSFGNAIWLHWHSLSRMLSGHSSTVKLYWAVYLSDD